MAKVMALDPGEARIGLAVSDSEGRLAFGRGILRCSGWRKDVEKLRELVVAEGASKVVVGLPLGLDGREGPAAARVRRFAERLGRRLECPVVLWDERLTTVEAERALRDGGHSRARRRERVDEEAARILLQSVLDAGSDGLELAVVAPPEPGRDA